VFSFKAFKSRLMLVTLSLFFDVAFVDRLWTDPNLVRATAGLVGIFIIGITGIVYSSTVLLLSVNPYVVAATLTAVGAAFFIAGGLKGRINIAFDLEKSRQALRSRGTVLCMLDDTQQSSSFIEVIISATQALTDENSLKASECYLLFATEIWRESLAKKGLHPLGDVFAKRSSGEMVAGKDSLPSV
jgi:hypothetical protein